eukprot:1160000-Pelagomonas_calceolata.AAC.22
MKLNDHREPLARQPCVAKCSRLFHIALRSNDHCGPLARQPRVATIWRLFPLAPHVLHGAGARIAARARRGFWGMTVLRWVICGAGMGQNFGFQELRL